MTPPFVPTITHVMAASDLSALAEQALARAFQIAVGQGATVSVAHVVNDRVLEQLQLLMGGKSALVEQQLQDAARTRLQAQIDAVNCDGIKPDIRLLVGEIITSLLQEADHSNAGLLVLGAAGESRMRRFVLGATVERMLQKTQRSLLVVRQPVTSPYRRILVPVDFSAWSLPSLQMARMLAPETRLVLLHAYEVPFEGQLSLAGLDEGMLQGYRTEARLQGAAQLKALAAEAQLSEGDYDILLRHGPAVAMIEQTLAQEGCDLVVMGKHGRGWMEEVLMGSATQHLVQEAGVDVLVVSKSMPSA
jgi:nucleotide-binding universal stress UspA family protein